MKNILVATDGSEQSGIARRYGVALAKRFKARLTGLHVIDIKIIEGPLFDDISGFMGLSPSQEFLSLIEKGLNERAEHILRDFEETCKKEGIDPAVIKVKGLVDEQIVGEGKNADLIIVAQKGEHYPLMTGVGLMGSTSEAVVRKSPGPVLVTPGTYRDISHVSLAFDGSDPSNRALKAAADFCRNAQCSLTALFINGESASSDLLRKKVGTFLEPYDIEYSVITREGKDEQEILRFTEEGTTDLLVMGAYGQSRIREFILGSTTSYVIRRSNVPVLLTR